MTIWVFATLLNIHGTQTYVIGDNPKYAVSSQTVCEQIIKDLKGMICIPLEVR